MTERRFDNKIAVVTGASEGIGFRIASRLAEEGALVYLIARTLPKLEDAKRKIEETGGKAITAPADITDFPQVKQIIDAIYTERGGIDIFVNNAGAWREQSTDSNFSEIRQLIELDMIAPYQIAFYLAGKAKDTRRSTKILTIESQASLVYLPGNLGYSPAKSGLTSAILNLENECKNNGLKNIRFYALFPNTVETEKTLKLVKEGKLQNAISMDKVVNVAISLITEATPTRYARVGKYQDGKSLVTYLTPDERLTLMLREHSEKEI